MELMVVEFSCKTVRVLFSISGRCASTSAMAFHNFMSM